MQGKSIEVPSVGKQAQAELHSNSALVEQVASTDNKSESSERHSPKPSGRVRRLQPPFFKERIDRVLSKLKINEVKNELNLIDNDTEAATEQRNTSVESVQDYDREIYQRDNLQVEKRVSASENWHLKSIDLTVSQNGQKLRMNDLLPEGSTIVEDLFATAGSYFDSGENRIVLPWKVFMPAEEKETHGESAEPDDFLALRGSLMTLLHEIGHIDDLNQLTEEERIHDRAVRMRLNEENKLEGSLSELSDADLQGYVDTIYRSERSAWMHAFKRYRQIKKETGIDLAEGRSAREVIQSTHTRLTTYEDDSNRVLSTYRNTTRKQPPATTSRK